MDLPQAAWAVACVGRLLAIEINPGVNVAALEADADKSPAPLPCPGGAVVRLARNVEVLACHADFRRPSDDSTEQIKLWRSK